MNHLSAVDGPTVVLTYEKMEELLGRKLPPTAYGASWRQWWANTETHSQALAWLRAGWRVTRPDFANKRVEFRRSAPDRSSLDGEGVGTVSEGRPHDVAEPILLSREHLTPSAIRMLEDASEETKHDLGRAVAELLNRASLARRRHLIDWFAENAPRAGGTSSVALIREDRDAG